MSETITSLIAHDNEEFEFQIVKFEKGFNPKDYIKEIPPKIITSVLLETTNIKILSFTKKMIGGGVIMRYLNNGHFTLFEGDVINIKTRYTREEKIPPFDGTNTIKIFSTKYGNFVKRGLNFNFTFLIELDPL